VTVNKSVLSGVLIGLAAGFTASADSIASVSGAVGDTTCSQSNANSATCLISKPIYDEAHTLSANATATWAPNESGTLEAQVRTAGTDASGSANVSFSDLLTVTGAAGSGTLQIFFSGSQTIVHRSGIPGQASVSQFGMSLGSFSTSVALPNAPQTFSVTAPILFGSPTSFNVAFGAAASGGFVNDSAVFFSSADGMLRFPTFVVSDANGNVLPNASVQFASPEPGTWSLIALGLTALPIVRRGRKQRAQNQT
jgi:hypothetical protein